MMSRTLTIKTDNCLIEGKSYITSISIIKQKLSLKNWTGSGFGHKIGRDGGSKKKKRRESGI